MVDAAIGLADDDGLDAVTMRRVAELVGAAPMTLYTYVPGKAELLDLMLDAVYARMPRTDTAGQPWRDRAAAVAEENRALFAAHPWAAEVSTARPPLGPGQMAKYEHELRALDGLGLTDVDLDAALAHLLAFVRSHADDPQRRSPPAGRAGWTTGSGGRSTLPCSPGSSTRPPTRRRPESAQRPAKPTAARGTRSTRGPSDSPQCSTDSTR